MRNRDGLSSPASLSSSAPHLFVYQGESSGDDDDMITPPPVYARPTTADSTSNSVRTPEAIYYSTTELDKKQDVIRRLSPIQFQPHHDPGDYAISRSSSEASAHPSSGKISDESSNRPNQLTKFELMRVETFFRGYRTQIFIGKSLANLYLRTAKSLVGLQRQTDRTDLLTDWQLKFTGIPVITLNTGSTKSRPKRKIQLILAERGTGFALWKDTIDNLSNYEATGPSFHTLRTSTDHRQIVGLSFDSTDAAGQFFRHVESLTADPSNIGLSTPNKKNGNRIGFFRKMICGKISPSTSRIPVRKSEISQPCFFQHVTSVDTTDRSKFFSLQALVPPQ